MTSSVEQICKRANAALTAGDPYAALSLYAQAVATTNAGEGHGCTVPTAAPAAGREWAQRLLLLGSVARGAQPAAALHEDALTSADRLRGRICLVVGTTGSDLNLADAETLLDAAFAGFSGTVISGGTASGVAQIVAGLGARHPQRIRTVGYAPDDTGDIDHRYHHLQFTRRAEFSPWEALQTWTDLLAASVDPGEVAVLGLGGGRISAAEYRIALALGGHVGIVEGLGRAGSELLEDPHWRAHPRLLRLPWDPAAVGDLVCGTATAVRRPPAGVPDGDGQARQ